MPVRLIYIMGTARSGSTLLNTLLDNRRDCVGVGELMELTRSEPEELEYCSCGQPRDRCEFWTEILNDWSSGCGSERTRDYRLLQARFERIRRWPKMLAAAHLSVTGFAEYAELTADLLRRILQVSRQSVVVESSKYPIRGFALSMIPDVDLRIIHLVRDPRGVAWSLKKSFTRDPRAGIPRDLRPRSALRSAFLWLLTCLQAEYVMTRLEPGRGIRIRYEDLVERPETICERIADLTGLDPIGSNVQLGARVLQPMGHAIAGNRVRMMERIRLEADLEWQARLLAADRKTVEKITRPMMKRYGYLDALEARCN